MEKAGSNPSFSAEQIPPWRKPVFFVFKNQRIVLTQMNRGLNANSFYQYHWHPLSCHETQCFLPGFYLFCNAPPELLIYSSIRRLIFQFQIRPYQPIRSSATTTNQQPAPLTHIHTAAIHNHYHPMTCPMNF
jgi:hypothetical protein